MMTMHVSVFIFIRKAEIKNAEVRIKGWSAQCTRGSIVRN